MGHDDSSRNDDGNITTMHNDDDDGNALFFPHAMIQVLPLHAGLTRSSATTE